MLRIHRKISRYLLPFILLNLSNSVYSMTPELKEGIPTATVSTVSESNANKVDSNECVDKSPEIIQKAEEPKYDEKKYNVTPNVKPEDNDLEQNSCKCEEFGKIIFEEMQNMQQIIKNITTDFNLNNSDLINMIEDFDNNLYKIIVKSWLRLYNAWVDCNSLLSSNDNLEKTGNTVLTQNPVAGMSRKDAWEYALTLGAGQNHGSYKTMSAKDFMEWWAASNHETLTDDEKARLTEISQPDNDNNDNGDPINFYKLIICRTF